MWETPAVPASSKRRGEGWDRFTVPRFPRSRHFHGLHIHVNGNNECDRLDRLLVILRSYFDGANQSDRIVLATVSGTSNQWKAFDSSWGKILYKHKAPFLHTTDAVSLNGEFSAKKGWTKASVNAFIGDCVMAISKHIAQPPTPRRPHVKPGLRATTLTIYVDDYKKKGSPRQTCLTWRRHPRRGPSTGSRFRGWAK